MRQLWNHRGLRYTFLSIALLALFGLSCYEAFIRAGERRWQRIEAKFKADGESLDFFSLYPPTVPEEENFCAIEPLRGIRIPDGTSPEAIEAQKKREAIAAALKPMEATGAEVRFSDLASWTQFPDPFKGEPDNAKEALTAIQTAGTLLPQTGEPNWAAVKLALEQHAPIIRQLSEAAEKRQKAAFLPRLTRETLPKMLVSIPDPTTAQELGAILSFYSLACLRSGNDKDALATLQAMFRLADASESEATMIGHVIATNIRDKAMRATHRLLARRNLGQPELIILQLGWQRLNLLSAHLRAVRSEMVSNVDSLSHLERNPHELNALYSSTSMTGSIKPPSVPSSLVVRAVLRHSKAAALEFSLNHFLSHLKRNGFRGYHLAMIKSKDELSALTGWTNIEWQTPQLFLYSYIHIGEMVSYQEDQRLQALLACALERHFIRHGRYPSTLEALDRDLRSGISLQDVNGEPMHYSPISGGRYRLWSPGPDGKDDGGKFGSEIATRGFKSSTPYNPNYLGDWVWRYDAATKAQ